MLFYVNIGGRRSKRFLYTVYRIRSLKQEAPKGLLYVVARGPEGGWGYGSRHRESRSPEVRT